MNAIPLTVCRCVGSSAPWGVELPAALRRAFAFAQAAADSTGVSQAGAEGRAAARDGAVDAADKADVQAAQSGDGAAYGRLVRRHQQEIGVYLWRFTRDRAQWEELVHDDLRRGDGHGGRERVV